MSCPYRYVCSSYDSEFCNNYAYEECMQYKVFTIINNCFSNSTTEDEALQCIAVQIQQIQR